MIARIVRLACLFACGVGWTAAATGIAVATENDRYKAIPVAGGGYVFIIDTREGHMWTWNSAAQGQASPSGANPKVVYQGNVRQNMKPPEAGLNQQPPAQSGQTAGKR